MSLHPDARAYLNLAAQANQPDISEQGAFLARLNSHVEADIAGPLDPTVTISYEFFTSGSADIPVAIYTPTGEGARAGMVYFHGGGWVTNYVAKYHSQLAALAAMTNSVIVSVNYQKAPEHKFPIPFDDCYAGLEWTIANSQRLGIDRSRVGIGGDSAGGNLAAGVAIAARDRGQHALAYQLLIYPCNGPEFVESPDVPCADGYGLTQRGMKWLWDCYLNGPEDRKNPYAVPHSAENFAGLAPAIVLTAQYDVLRVDGLAYKSKLESAGSLHSFIDCPGMIHGFFNRGKYIPYGIEIRSWIAGQINSLVNR